MTSTIIFLLILGAALWFWQDSLKARETATRVGREACQYMDIQFLDETVALERWRPVRAPDGRMRIRRIYSFEFSTEGTARYRGHIHMLAHSLEHLDLSEAEKQIT